MSERDEPRGRGKSASWRQGFQQGRLAGLKEALAAADVEELIAVWIRRPAPDTPEGRAWADGARQAFEWKAAAIRALAAEEDMPEAGE
jgi:hypothetical protein